MGSWICRSDDGAMLHRCCRTPWDLRVLADFIAYFIHLFILRERLVFLKYYPNFSDLDELNLWKQVWISEWKALVSGIIWPHPPV
jgi:hypothetical protein